jgi:hypothetical protein
MAASGMAFISGGVNALTAGVLAPLLWHSAATMAAGSLVAVMISAALFTLHVRSPHLVPTPTR